VSKAFTKEDDASNADIVRRPLSSDAIHLTPSGVERLRQDLHNLERQRSDKESSERLEHLIREIRQKLAQAVVVETPADDGFVRFGATVTVRGGSDGEESQYRIVGPAEVDLDRGWISSVSPLGKALLNRKVGERFPFKYPAGEDTLEIVSVSY
jgi:transcription elongation GreA/GreB family factor